MGEITEALAGLLILALTLMFAVNTVAIFIWLTKQAWGW